MSEPAKKKATYEDLYSVPDNMTGEIINGELIVTPRPSRRHTNAASSLGFEIGPAYQLGRGGPGGWKIIIEPEISLDDNVLVPDLAGWRKERFPESEKGNPISVVPDWVCEILSPGTTGKDKVKKIPTYAHYKVPNLLLIDPLEKTLEVFRLESGRWALLGAFLENEKVRAEPFGEIEIELGNLWLS
jgi:Uma2 family endonuclease